MNFDKRSGRIVFTGNTPDSVSQSISIGDQVTLYAKQQPVFACVKQINDSNLVVEITYNDEVDRTEETIEFENIFGVEKG